MRLYVGNIPFSTKAQHIRQLFESYGVVGEVQVMSDRATGRPRGFGFVTMPNAHEAQTAIDQIDGTTFEGRSLRVNEARPRDRKSRY